MSKEVISCDHHEMVVTPFGIYPRREHDSKADFATACLVAVETNNLDKRMHRAEQNPLSVSKQPAVVTRPQWFFK
jgi:hypothetical protein